MCNVCGKSVTKKNISTHQKTVTCKSHLPVEAVQIEETKDDKREDNVTQPDQKIDEKIDDKKDDKKDVKQDNALKIKLRFDAMDQKLDVILELLTEIYEDGFEDEEDNPILVRT